MSKVVLHRHTLRIIDDDKSFKVGNGACFLKNRFVDVVLFFVK